MIKPTVGRVVWVWREQSEDTTQPERADVVFVNGDHSVNVAGTSKSGYHFFIPDLLLLQPDDANQDPQWPYACWMPYQKAIAAGEPPVKHDQR
jgi:hypothetical protein